MQPRKRVSWKDVSRIFPASPEETEKGRLLFISFEKKGYLDGGVLSPHSSSKAVIIDFFYRLSMIRSIESPVYRKKKSSWIYERDFAYINHRSLPFIEEFPFFAQLSVLPSVRAGALIFAPFTVNRKKEVNTVDSHALISPDFCDPELIEKDVSMEEQFHLLIEAVHLLGKCIGYPLDYRVDRFAVPVLRRPDLFRWVDTNSSEPYREMLTEKSQKLIVDKIKKLVGAHISNLKMNPSEDDYNNIRKDLVTAGFWTVPSCGNKEEMLPSYESDEHSSLPRFRGGDENLTSFKFSCSLDSFSSLRPEKSANNAALDYYSSLYIKWRDNFSFDFIKFQGIDYADDEKMRKADSPSMDMISKVIRKTMGNISHTGIVGALCANPEELMESGFNALFHQGSSFVLDRNFMEQNFKLYTYLLEINRKKKKQLSILFDSGDAEDGSPQVLENCCRRIFISRFISCSDSFRPKYEMWNNSSNQKNLSDMPLYNMIENIYTRYRNIVRKGKIVKHYSDTKVAWWIIHYGNNLLIPLISLDNSDEQTPSVIEIDYSGIINSSRVLSVLDYDFTSSGGNLFLCGDETIFCEDLVYRKIRLFSVQ